MTKTAADNAAAAAAAQAIVSAPDFVLLARFDDNAVMRTLALGATADRWVVLVQDLGEPPPGRDAEWLSIAATLVEPMEASSLAQAREDAKTGTPSVMPFEVGGALVSMAAEHGVSLQTLCGFAMMLEIHTFDD